MRFFALIAAATALSFEEFKAKYDKVYASPEEEAERKQIYKQTLERIAAHEKKGATYTIGVTRFADWTHEEFKAQYIAGFQKPADLKQMWGDVPLTDFDASQVTGDLPKAVDWRDKGAVSPVQDQGACGSCWTFSASGALEGAVVAELGQPLVPLSQQELVDCAPGKGCKGGSMPLAFQWVAKNGLCPLETYPYQCKMGENTPECQASSCHKCSGGLAANAVKNIAQVKKDDTALMSALTLQPVSVAIQADLQDFMHYTGGVYNDNDCKEHLDHGVLAVGYGTDAEGGDYYLVKNSWSDKWGESGYLKLARGANLCGILDFATIPLLKDERAELVV